MLIKEKISLIIPAFNEQDNIGKVLSVVTKLDWVDEIIVVNDCSTDKTLEVAKRYKVKVETHKTNMGKGAAMATGAKAAKYNCLLFIDADLSGLTETHLLRILSPLIFTREVDLSLGVFGIKKLSENGVTKIANRAFPAITGQRAIWKWALPDLERLAKARYGADLIMTRALPRKRRAVVKLDGLSQITKEKKNNDIMKSMTARMKMYKEILKSLNQ